MKRHLGHRFVLKNCTVYECQQKSGVGEKVRLAVRLGVTCAMNSVVDLCLQSGNLSFALRGSVGWALNIKNQSVV